MRFYPGLRVDKREEIQGGPGRVVWVVVALAAAAVAMVGAFYYAQAQRERAQVEVRRNTFALCVAQNTAREATRASTLSVYKLVVSVLRAGGPADTRQHKVFVRQEGELAKQLTALRPLNCETYVRPNLPPDEGHG